MKNEIVKCLYQSIGLLDRVKIIDGCKYIISKPEMKREFVSLKDAVCYAIRKFYNSKKTKYIVISIINEKISNKMGDGNRIEDGNILDVINETTKFAYERFIWIPTTFEEIYFEYYSYAGGRDVCFDYGLLYKVHPLLESGMCYISEFVDKYFERSQTLKYEDIETGVFTPIAIRRINNEQINRSSGAGDYYYGYSFFPQSNYKSGLVMDWADTLPLIIPVASMRKYNAKRPKYEDFKRYKVTLRVRSDTDKGQLETVYIDHRKSDPNRMMNIAKLSLSKQCNWWVDIVPVRIEEIPDGEWIWEEG